LFQLSQDTFIDYSRTATALDKSGSAHNVALLQDEACFSLLHRRTSSRPQPFAVGSATLSTWFGPMGAEVDNGQLMGVWAQW
jgi:hypothetical protein